MIGSVLINTKDKNISKLKSTMGWDRGISQ